MALEFEDKYKFIEGQTKFNAQEMNNRFEDLDKRLNLLEQDNILTFYSAGVLAVGDVLNFVWPFLSKDVSMGLGVKVAPIDADLIFQLTVGGVDAFLTAERPIIADGLKFGNFSALGTGVGSFTIGQQAILKVTQIGSTTPGSDLAMIIKSEKALL